MLSSFAAMKAIDFVAIVEYGTSYKRSIGLRDPIEIVAAAADVRPYYSSPHFVYNLAHSDVSTIRPKEGLVNLLKSINLIINQLISILTCKCIGNNVEQVGR